MGWIPQRFDARKVMAAGQGQIAAKTMRPSFANEAVLSPEFFALVGADSSDQGHGESGSIPDRADTPGRIVIKTQVGTQEERAHQRLQVIDAGNADGAFEKIPRKIA